MQSSAPIPDWLFLAGVRRASLSPVPRGQGMCSLVSLWAQAPLHSFMLLAAGPCRHLSCMADTASVLYCLEGRKKRGVRSSSYRQGDVIYHACEGLFLP